MNKPLKILALSIIFLVFLPGLIQRVTVQAANSTIFLGLSGYSTGTSQVQNIIDVMNEESLNTYRISFNPEWFNRKPHPYNSDYVQYFLDHSSYTIIVDRNHLYPSTEASAKEARNHWNAVKKSVFQVLETWPNNQRVMVELVNEYVSDDFYPRMQSLVDEIRDAGYTNPVVVNKWNQPWTVINDPIDNTYQGYHYYFNTWSPAGAIQQIRIALSRGIKLINTEVGADYREHNYFTEDAVDELNAFMAECASLGVGNAVWMNENLNNWPSYQELYLDFPTGSSETEDTTPPTISSLTPADGALTTRADLTIAASVSDASGVDTNSIFMTIDDGLVTPTYDENTGLVSYEATTMEDGLHSVRLDASDTLGNLASTTWSFTIDTVPPAQITEVTVTTMDSSQLDVSWTANTEPDLSYYNVYRSSATGGPYALVASPNFNLYSDSGLMASTDYCYVVTAVDNAGNEGIASLEASGLTSEAPPQPTIHVASIDFQTEIKGKSARANLYINIKILDSTGLQVEGATVDLKLLWDAENTYISGVTDSSGQAAFKYNQALVGGEYAATVTNVAKEGWAYDSSLNVETEDNITI